MPETTVLLMSEGPACVKMVRVAGGCYNWSNPYDSYVSKNIMKENIWLDVRELRFTGVGAVSKTEAEGVVTVGWIKGSRQSTEAAMEVAGLKGTGVEFFIPSL